MDIDVTGYSAANVSDTADHMANDVAGHISADVAGQMVSHMAD